MSRSLTRVYPIIAPQRMRERLLSVFWLCSRRVLQVAFSSAILLRLIFSRRIRFSNGWRETVLEVRLLGQFDVRRDGAAVGIPSRAAQSLFAFLVLTAGTMHRREKLAGQLWPETTEENARKSLRHELWRLRKAIETKTPRKRGAPFLAVDEISIGFNAESDYWLDVSQVQQKLGKQISVDDLSQTLSLYRGELLPGWYDEWVALERERVHAAFEQKMARLLDLLVEEQRWQETLEWGQRWIALGQTPEPAYRGLMVAHGALGNMAQVASVYERCVRALRDELGVEPADQTRALFEQLSKKQRLPERATLQASTSPPRATIALSKSVLRQSLIASASSPSHPPLHRAGYLPVPLTSFIGREREIHDLRNAFSTTRLLTLTGAGGLGKTRLAIQLASDLSSEYKDGSWWVDLVPLFDPALVPQAVAKALGVREIPNVPLIETLADILCSKQILLVLDNCEHLVAAAAQLVEFLLGSCASIKILTTSREALGISGETIWRVPSLSLPTAEIPLSIEELGQYESARLFIERARAANSGFAPTKENAVLIVHISRRLDGIPLAIELAAARVKTLAVQQIAMRLDDRFNLLARGSRTALPRHQTLRATIDWSYELLSESEKVLFRRLAVFAGGWTLEGAEFVCAGDGLQDQVYEVLARLVDKSLVIAEEQEGASRYRMLETIRQYAREKLRDSGEEDAAQRRHLEFFLNLAEESEPLLFRGVQSSILDRLELELDNLRAAADWAIQNQQVIAALRLVSAIPRFWFIRAHHIEGLERLRSILALPEARRPSPARLKALNAYLFMLWPSGQLTEFQSLIEEALSLGRMFEDRWNTAYALLWLGLSNTFRGDYALALAHLEQSLEIYRKLGDKTYSGWALVFLGEVELLQGDTARAQALYEQAISRLKDTKDYPFLAIPLRRLGQLAMARGDLIAANTFVRESLADNWIVRDYRGVAACLSALGTLSMAQAQINRATQLFGAVETILEFIRTPLLPFDQKHYHGDVATLHAQMDETAFAAAWAAGHAMSLEQAIAFAMDDKITD